MAPLMQTIGYAGTFPEAETLRTAMQTVFHIIAFFSHLKHIVNIVWPGLASFHKAD
jgi:hypothetical protein